MELTGIAGTIIGWAVLITSYVIVIIGILVAWHWILDQLLTKVFIYLKLYKRAVQWIWHMKEFHEWRKRNKQQ